MLTFVWFFLALSFLVLIHEFGHYIVAKSFKVYVHEFSIFMGPLLYQKQIGETKYSIRLLPIGGYCSMAGELDMQAEGQDDEGLNIPPERTLVGINRFKQFLVAFAGPFMNILLALILAMVCFLGKGDFVGIASNKVVISENGILAEAGLKTGDKINRIESELVDTNHDDKIIIEKTGADVDNFFEINQYLGTCLNYKNDIGKAGKLEVGFKQNLTLWVNGNETPIYVSRTFTQADYVEEGLILQPKLGLSYDPGKVGFGQSIALSAEYNWMMGTEIFRAVGKLFTKEGFQNVAGIVGMYDAASEVTSYGSIYAILNFVAMISINLGLLNLLPFPGLDGGRILILLGESITRKKLPAKVESVINNLGFIFLLGLIIAVTIKDIFFSSIVSIIFRL